MGRSYAIYCNPVETLIFSFDHLSNSGVVDIEMNVPVLNRKRNFQDTRIVSYLNWIGVFALSLFPKVTFRN